MNAFEQRKQRWLQKQVEAKAALKKIDDQRALAIGKLALRCGLGRLDAPLLKIEFDKVLRGIKKDEGI